MKNNTFNSVGRPYLPLEKKRRVRSIKMSDQEWQEIRSRASEETMSASKYIREKVLGGWFAPHKKNNPNLWLKELGWNNFKSISEEVLKIILRDSLNNIRETTDKPKILIPVILQGDESATNAARGNIQSKEIKKWIERPMECVIESIYARKNAASLIRYPMPEAKIIKQS